MPAPTDAYGNLIWNETGLQSYWRFGELSGTSAADAKGTNTGTYQGTPTLGGAGIPVRVLSAKSALEPITSRSTIAISRNLPLSASRIWQSLVRL